MNQQVARRFLERLGCEVTVVENGALAVQACARQKFDLVLMDVQMPVMDGLTATRAIRAARANGGRMPIVALTASVMTDELERCTVAGMDGLLTKPLELPRLREVMDNYGLEFPVSELPAPAASTAEPQARPLDMAQLNATAGGDAHFLQQLCSTFVTSTQEVISGLERALLTDDRAGLAALAHTLKGSSGSLGAHALASMAAELETNARDQIPEQLARSVGAIRSCFGQIASYIATEVR